MALNVTCVIASVSRLAGGMLEAERGLQRAASGVPGLTIRVLGLRDRFTNEDGPAWAPVPVDTVSARRPMALGRSPELAPLLFRAAPDVVYSAGLWMYPSHAVLQWIRRTGRPSVAAPHGMLDPWAVRRGWWKKRIVGWWFEDERLRRASVVRALCESEAMAIRSYGLTNPICVVPNGVEPPPAGGAGLPPWADAVEPGQKVLLYLGRLHPKKGIDALVAGWEQARRREPALRRDWRLVIAGWDQAGYERTLRQAVATGGCGAWFAGPLYGAAKESALAAAAAVALPSRSEGLPMVVLEAWARSKPVVMTPSCNLPEGFAAGAALRADPEPGSLAGALCELAAMGDADRAEMGRRGKRLVDSRYAWQNVAAEYVSVLRWLTSGGPRPGCMWDG